MLDYEEMTMNDYVEVNFDDIKDMLSEINVSIEKVDHSYNIKTDDNVITLDGTEIGKWSVYSVLWEIVKQIM